MGVVIVRVKNEWFEICMRDPSHPYHNKQCDMYCPNWVLCQQGEFVEVRKYLIVDADSLKKLGELEEELRKRGFKVKVKEEWRWR